MKNLFLALALLVAPALPPVHAAPQPFVPGGPSVPYHARVDLHYELQSIDPVTGHLITTGTASPGHGTFGATSGPFALDLDLATFAFTGSRLAIARDGSSYLVEFGGQFLDATHSVGTFTVKNGTGRFEGLHVEGTFRATEWSNGLGSASYSTGVATF